MDMAFILGQWLDVLSNGSGKASEGEEDFQHAKILQSDQLRSKVHGVHRGSLSMQRGCNGVSI